MAHTDHDSTYRNPMTGHRNYSLGIASEALEEVAGALTAAAVKLGIFEEGYKRLRRRLFQATGLGSSDFGRASIDSTSDDRLLEAAGEKFADLEKIVAALRVFERELGERSFEKLKEGAAISPVEAFEACAADALMRLAALRDALFKQTISVTKENAARRELEKRIASALEVLQNTNNRSQVATVADDAILLAIARLTNDAPNNAKPSAEAPAEVSTFERKA